MKKYKGIELLKNLSELFGPSGCEYNVADFIVSQVKDFCDAYFIDRFGNVVTKICGSGNLYNAQNPTKLMLTAHMDEVGVMVSEITQEGYLKFQTIGGIDPRVLCGKVVLIGDHEKQIKGIISSKAIHLQSQEERGKVTAIDKMYIDIGATDEKDAEKYVSVGDVGVFSSEFIRFGKDFKYIKGKALDDRFGCAVAIDIMRVVKEENIPLSCDLYVTFTCCEEIGISGAKVAAQEISPSIAIILEATAVADISGVSESKTVATLGEGGAISFMDNGTIYNKQLFEVAMNTAKKHSIKAQVKRYVSGGNDAAHIQRSMAGVKVLAISVPARYIHSQSNVIHFDDFEAIKKLIIKIISDNQLK